jgi:hypothetical protein
MHSIKCWVCKVKWLHKIVKKIYITGLNERSVHSYIYKIFRLGRFDTDVW